MAVVQFGFAISRAEPIACALTSGTTSGTAGSMRNADELSITIGPPLAASAAACSSANEPETARKAKALSRTAATEKASMVTSPYGVASALPAERSEAKSRSRPTGNDRLWSTVHTSTPTAPVAPTTATSRPAIQRRR